MKNRALVALLGMVFSFTPLFSQNSQKPDSVYTLPIDTAVKTGTLPNGMTYFIRHNEYPKNRVNVCLAQRVGSVQEDNDEAGFTRFLNRMALQGTQNFPGTGVVDFLTRNGLWDKDNLSISSGYDETTYLLSGIPANESALLDSCLLLLHDWSHLMTLSDASIEKERVKAWHDWLMRNNAHERMLSKALPVLLPNKYGQCKPMGDLEVLRSFSPEDLRSFYKKWFQPNMQAIIVVGDVDEAQVEAQLKRLFDDIPKPSHEPSRRAVKVAENKKPIVSIATDPDATTTNLSVYFKTHALDRKQKSTVYGLVQEYLKEIIEEMFDQRMAGLEISPDAPFFVANVSVGRYLDIAPSMDAFSFQAQVKKGQIAKALQQMSMEIKRIATYGFTAEEYARAQAHLLNHYKQAHAAQSKQRNNYYLNRYRDYFIYGGNISCAKSFYSALEQVAPNVPVEAINQMLKDVLDTQKNLVISLQAPTPPKGTVYPTQAQLLAAYNQGQNIALTAYKETFKSNELTITPAPKEGKVLSTTVDRRGDATVLKLSNGAEIYYKQTDNNDNVMKMCALSKGGLGAYAATPDVYNAKVLNDMVSLNGLGNYDANSLAKLVAGHEVSLKHSFDLLSTRMDGRATKGDLEMLFKLIYLSFMPSQPNQQVFEAYKQRKRNEIEANLADPLSVFKSNILSVMYPGNIYKAPLSAADLTKVDYARAMQMVRKAYESPADFQFFFVGNLATDSLASLAEKYIASLPATKASGRMDLSKVPAVRGGERVLDKRVRFDTPLALSADIYTKAITYNAKNRETLAVLARLLNMRFRSAFGMANDAFSVVADSELAPYPYGQASLAFYVSAEPTHIDSVNRAMRSLVDGIQKQGVTAQDLTNVKKVLIREYEQQETDNLAVLKQLEMSYFWNQASMASDANLLQTITSDDVQEMLKNLRTSGNECTVVVRSDKHYSEGSDGRSGGFFRWLKTTYRKVVNGLF